MAWLTRLRASVTCNRMTTAAIPQPGTLVVYWRPPKDPDHGSRFNATHETQAMKTGWKSRRSQSRAGGAFSSPGMLP